MAEKTWSIERLNGENWSTWKFQMKHLLLVKNLWKITQGTEQLSETADNATAADFNSRSQNALSTIVMSISPEQLYLITSCESAKDAWDNLKQQFESNTLQNKLLLKKQYFRAEMSESLSLEKHLKAMKELMDKLAAVGSPISEEDQIVTLLGSLPMKYNAIVTALEARGDDLKLQFVQQALLNEEQKFVKPEGDSLLVAQAVIPKKSKSKSKIVCYHCGKQGHIKKNCIEFKKKKKNEFARIAVNTTEFAFTSALVTGKFEGWCIDSGATSHVCNDANLFKCIDSSA